MPDPLVSVVIPTYNRAHLLAGALHSVLAQTVPCEIIVVDDGSTDGTARMLAGKALPPPLSMSVPFPLTVVAGEHRGANAARNLGIAQAKAPFIAFLDSDDRFLPQKLARQIPLFDDPLVGAAYCGFFGLDLEPGAKTHEPRPMPSGDLSAMLLERDVTAPTSTIVARTALVRAIGGFDEALPARQDWDFVIRLSERHQIAVVREALVAFGHHSAPRTASDPSREITAYALIRRKYAARLHRLPFPARCRARGAYFRRMARVHRSFAPVKAAGFALAALACAPGLQNLAVMVAALTPAPLRRRGRARWNQIFGATRLGITSH